MTSRRGFSSVLALPPNVRMFIRLVSCIMPCFRRYVPRELFHLSRPSQPPQRPGKGKTSTVALLGIERQMASRGLLIPTSTSTQSSASKCPVRCGLDCRRLPGSVPTGDPAAAARRLSAMGCCPVDSAFRLSVSHAERTLVSWAREVEVAA